MPNAILNYVIVVFLIICVLGMISVVDTYLKRKNEIYLYQVDTQHRLDKTPSDLLEEFINQCFIEYQLIVLIPKQELHINTDREREICTDLTARVAKYISPHLLAVVSQQYNTDMIHDIIADKIYIIVTNYVVSHNETIQTQGK